MKDKQTPHVPSRWIDHACIGRRVHGLTLVECLMAMVVLSIAALGLTFVTTAGAQHLQHAERGSRAIRLAEHLMEEIASRPYAGSGASRLDWCLSDYNGYEELPGNLRDFAGTLYEQADQSFTRSVSIADTTTTVAQLGGMSLTGKTVTIRVGLSQENQWIITRFIPSPVSP